MTHRLRLGITRFTLVGLTAFLVHWTCAVSIVGLLNIHPLLANISGFVCAFPVSFWGHKNWTFSAGDHPPLPSLVRFLITAFSGFLVNESAYAMYLAVFPDSYRVGLVFALIFSASCVYLLSRYWVFPVPPEEH